MITCRGYSRHTYDGIQAASGSLRQIDTTSDEEPICAVCHRGVGEYLCVVCACWLCVSDAKVYGRDVFCAKCDADEEKAEGAAA